MSAITAALSQIDEVASEGDLAPQGLDDLSLEAAGEPVELPDGRMVFPPSIHGEPLHGLAGKLLDSKDPARSRFLRLIGPPGTGKSQLARAIAYTLWSRRGRRVETRFGAPFYGFVEMQLGPSSDEWTFRHEFVPVGESGQVKLIDSAFVQAMRNGWMVMLDEVNVARDTALLSINATIDGRLSLYLPATGETVTAAPGFCLALAYNNGLVGATDLPEAWYSRFPATVEVRSNWPALVRLGCPALLVKAAAALDARRMAGDDGLVWTPQFREIESLHWLIGRVGERLAISLFASDLHERATGGRIQDAEAAAACRMLDQAGYARLKVSVSSGVPNLHGYPRAVTS
jgi:hypothetical protein